MIFSEQKTDKGYLYKTEDSFGRMEFESKKKLEAEILDDAFVAVFNTKAKSKTTKGTIQGTDIKFKYVKKSQWTTIKK